MKKKVLSLLLVAVLAFGNPVVGNVSYADNQEANMTDENQQGDTTSRGEELGDSDLQSEDGGKSNTDDKQTNFGR